VLEVGDWRFEAGGQRVTGKGKWAKGKGKGVKKIRRNGASASLGTSE
jgi:hypothetical protein